MKTPVFGLVLLLVCAWAAPAGADTCLKKKRHTDSYYYGGVVTPEETVETELWFGDDKMAIYSPNRIVIVDAERGVLIFANNRDSSYVETMLPFDWENVVDENTAGYLARYRTEGTVTETGETKRVNGRECRLFEIETWIEDGGTKFNQREQRAWVTTDLPIDWEMYEKLYTNGMVLSNFDAALIETLSGIQGITIEADTDVYQQGFSVESTERTVEILEAGPEKDVYSLPAYFRKKEQLTMADLRG